MTWAPSHDGSAEIFDFESRRSRSLFLLKIKPKTQKLLLSTWDKFKRNGDNTSEVKLFSFENIIEISSLISSECMCIYVISS